MASTIEPELTLLEAASLLSGSSEWDSRPLPAKGVPSFVMSDGPHGIRRQLGSGDHLGIAQSEPATCFPTAAAVATSWDPGLAEDMGRALGDEALALGVDVVLGPGLNIKRSPLCGRNFEYYSEDPLLAGRMAAGLVRGIQSTGVSACPKHFAVNSQELRRMASDSVVDERTMREIYLTAFEIVVRESGPRALMSSYNLVNGTYAHENPHLLTDILREEWGFDGMVVSDWGGSNSAVAAARAGGSLEMPAPGLHSAREIVAAVERGDLAESHVRERAAEVLTMARAAAASRDPRPVLDADAHHALARRIAAESIVLMRNEDSILPLAPGTRVGVVGDMAKTPRYQGSGSSQVNPTRLETILDAIGATDLDLVGYAQGYDRQGAENEALAAEALDLAGRCDVVLACIGLDELSESEGLDRSHMRLPRVQTSLVERLAEINRNVVVVLSTGSAVETYWVEHARAVIHTGLSGQAGASAALRVLTGDVNPSGRLAETYPLRYEDTPTAGWYPAEGPLSLYREGPYVGYRYYASTGIDVAYPFGFGLSYCDIEYSDLRVGADGARVTLTNASDVDGAEVVQLYVRAPGGVFGPDRELKGFVKARVPARSSLDVEIPFDAYTFRHWESAESRWATEAGEWTILIGRNARDIVLEGALLVEGTTPAPVDERLGHYLTGDVAEATDAEFEALLGRPIPVPPSTGALGATDPLSSMSRARSRLARMVAANLAKRRERADATGRPDLNILFVTNMPFRAMAKMTRGMVSTDMVDGVVDIVNGHHLRGLRTTIGGFFRNRAADRATRRALDGESR
ncbi:glycoside hydrolase family 3 C-terminal domain-containing protein [Actinomyces sp. B33]|uniref:glycoside hydrolase family 3 protein n=1 Tax=Actinomyces sp. B33 TaxID=2942131 RepID=UPI0023403CF5|nr:glycoside hydrolase family 3 protein [Actinomyces sp. B33]MDC4232919.1 glycoside hydrolase family 3 C-terminal domain-containing protein [Actinomyces sp. B33]